MKKIIAAIMSITVIASMASAALASGELSKVNVTASDVSESVSDTYSSGMSGATDEVEINSLMSNLLKNLTATKDVTQDITITSTSANSQPVGFWLKLELPDAYASAQYEATAVDYYSIRITDSSNNVIYNDADSNKQTGLKEKKIKLGTMNENGDNSETKTYKLYVSVNKNVNTSVRAGRPEEVIWKLVYTDDGSMFSEAAPTPYINLIASPTKAPAQASAAPTVAPEVTAAPTATPSSKTITIKVTSDTKSDGDVIKPGTYKLIGSGHTVVTDKNGKKKYEFDLTQTVDSQPVTTLTDGDVVTVNGDGNAYVQFKAPASSASSSKTAATASPSSKATAQPTAAAKENPKTGDNAPIVCVSITALLALAAIAYIGLTSRKKSGK